MTVCQPGTAKWEMLGWDWKELSLLFSSFGSTWLWTSCFLFQCLSLLASKVRRVSPLKLSWTSQRGVREVGNLGWFFQALKDVPTTYPNGLNRFDSLGQMTIHIMAISGQKFREPQCVYFHYKEIGCESWLGGKHKTLFFSKWLLLAAKHSMDVENKNCVHSMFLPCTLPWSTQQMVFCKPKTPAL